MFTLRGCSHLRGISIRYKYYFKIVFIQEGVHISGVLTLGGFSFCIPKITGNFMYLFYKSGCLEQRYGYFQVTRGRFRQFPYKTCLCVFVGVKGGGGCDYDFHGRTLLGFMYFASTKLLEVFVCSGIYYDSLCNLCYLMNNNNHNTMCVTTTSVYRFHSIYIYYYYSNIVFQLHFNTLAFNLTFFYVYLGSDSASFTNFYILCVVMTQVRKVSHH